MLAKTESTQDNIFNYKKEVQEKNTDDNNVESKVKPASWNKSSNIPIGSHSKTKDVIDIDDNMEDMTDGVNKQLPQPKMKPFAGMKAEEEYEFTNPNVFDNSMQKPKIFVTGVSFEDTN